MNDPAALRALQERVRSAEGPDIELDAAIDVTIFGGETVWKTTNYTMEQYPASRRPSLNHVGGFANEYVPRVTSSIDACMALISTLLPNWWITCGLCELTGHASIGPDYNGSAGERLRAEFPVALFDGTINADLPPGNGTHRTCYALLDCLLQALIAIEERKASHTETGEARKAIAEGEVR